MLGLQSQHALVVGADRRRGQVGGERAGPVHDNRAAAEQLDRLHRGPFGLGQLVSEGGRHVGTGRCGDDEFVHRRRLGHGGHGVQQSGGEVTGRHGRGDQAAGRDREAFRRQVAEPVAELHLCQFAAGQVDEGVHLVADVQAEEIAVGDGHPTGR